MRFSDWLNSKSFAGRSPDERRKKVGERARRRRALADRRLQFQSLEQRAVLSAVSWIGPAAGGNWDVAANWSGNAVPGAADDVTISTASAGTITIKPGDTESVHSLVTAANDTLSFTGGALTVHASSSLSGPLNMTGGSLTASGSGATLTANGASSISGGSLFADTGGVLNMPMVTSYTAPAQGSAFQANGAGSQVNLPNLTTLNGAFNANYINVNTQYGGVVDLHQLPQITSGAVHFEAQGPGSTINLSALTSFSATSNAAVLESDGGATLNIGNLSTLNNVALLIGGPASVGQITSVTNGSITAQYGTTVTMSGLNTFTGDSFYASNAGVLNLPTIASYTGPITGSNFIAYDIGSQINLLNLTTLNGALNGSTVFVHAYSGALIDMHQLPQITSGAVRFLAEGAGTAIDLSALASFTATSSGATLESDSGAALDIGSLTSLNNVALTIGGAASIGQIASVTNGSISARDGAIATFSGLTNSANDSFYANSGGTLNLPTVTSYTVPSNTYPSIAAADPGSKLNLPNLVTLNGGTNGNYVFVHTYGGGQIDMHQLPQITSGAVSFKTEGAGSTLDLSALTKFTATSLYAAMESDSGAALDIGNLTTLDKVALTVGGPASVAQITGLTNGSITARDGATPTFTGLTTYTNDSFYANAAGILNLPTVTSYSGSSTSSPLIQAGDSGSEINLGNLTTLVGSTNGYVLNFNAYGGALIDVHQLRQITSGSVYFHAHDNGTTIDLSDLTTFTATSLYAKMESDSGAMLDIGKLTTLDNVAIIIGGTASVSQITSVTNGSITARDSATATFTGLANFTNDSFYANAAGILNLPTVTTYSGPSSFSPSIQAGDNGSQINLVSLTTLNGATNSNRVFVHAYGGAQIDMHHLTQIPTGAVYFQAQDTGSTIDVSGLTTFTATTPGAGVEVDNGGIMKLDSLATFSGGSIVTSNDTLTLPALTQGNLTLHNGDSVTVQGTLISLPASGASGAVINVPASQGLTVTLNNTGTFSGGTSFNVGGGSSIVLAGGTYLGGATFNLGNGATVDLTGGQQPNYGGTLTSSGNGTVNLATGGIHPAVGGVTLNFPGNTFQWSGGAFFAASGDVTNLGTMNLTGSNDKGSTKTGHSTTLAPSIRPVAATWDCTATTSRPPRSRSNPAAVTESNPTRVSIIPTVVRPQSLTRAPSSRRPAAELRRC